MATIIAGFKRPYREIEGAIGTTQRLTRPHHVSTPPRGSDQGPKKHIHTFNGDGESLVNGSPNRSQFEPLASIVLIGVRGVGKSTLGILAATAYSRRLVDSERAFHEATGETGNAYRKKKGTVDYRSRHHEVLQATLNNNSSGAVIVCTFSDLEGQGAEILRNYAKSHPIIHITRDVEGIQSILQVWSSERINELLLTSAPLLRSCSNYEFFNLSQARSKQDLPDSHAQHEALPAQEKFLTLKRVERDFLRLLRNAIGDHDRGQAHHSAYPFSQVDVEQRRHTFAVTLSVSEILQCNLDLEDVQIGADCMELTVKQEFTSKRQYFQDISSAFAIIRRATILPIMLSLDVTQTRQNNETAVDTIDFFLRLGAEFVCIDTNLYDAQLARLVHSKGFSKVIGCLDLPERPVQGWSDPSVLSAYSRAVRMGCDLFKVTMPAASAEDAFALQALHNHVSTLENQVPFIVYNTGSRGRTSKCFNATLTSVRPHHVKSPEHTTDVSARDITEALFSIFVFEPMRFFIFGGDVSYSLSPAMHNAAYKACGMKYTYEAFSSDSLENLKGIMQSQDFGGTAVTQPYKTTALELMDGLSPHAKVIGAVNTVVPIRQMDAEGSIPGEAAILSRRSQQGPVLALYGFNTDWIGIRACIRKGLSPANTIRNHSTALVCGAGGMASAAIYSLVSLGVRHIFVCNRTLSRGNALVEHYNRQINDKTLPELRSENASETRVKLLESFATEWPSNARSPTMIISCIPRQTTDHQTINLTLPDSWLNSPTGGVVLEVAYRQPKSSIAHQIKSRASAGWIFMDGYDVLPEQAFSQFELFTGRRAPRKLMKDEVDKHAQR